MSKKVILVTGGFGRVGYSLCKNLLAQGFKVILVDKTIKNIDKSRFRKSEYYILKADINKEREIKRIISFGLKKFKKIDALVHCAYPKTKDWGTKLENLKQKSLNENLSNHLGSSIIISKNILKVFLKQNYGKLILLSSVMGIKNPKFETYKGTNMYSPVEYSAIKSGIISITRWLAKRYSKQNIRVNCISLGGILDQQPKSFLKLYQATCNSKGMLDAEDVSGVLLFLLSSCSQYLTGQNIIVDDGWSL